MVQVAHAVPSLASVLVGSHLMSIAGGLVVGADVVVGHLVGYALVGLSREVGPRGEAAAVVDDHVGDGLDAVVLEGLDECAQLLLGAEAAVVVSREPIEVVVAHRLPSAIAALRQPHQVEGALQLVGLCRQFCPLTVVVAVPVESLQHHATVLRGPALCQRPYWAKRQTTNDK